MNGINTQWLNAHEISQVHALRHIALAAQHDPLLIDRDPHTLAKIGYFTPIIKSCRKRCHMMEVFGYGDMAIILGLPGLSLTGMLLKLLSKEKKLPWLEHIIDGQFRTFFAVTEPNKGTDANHLQSHISTRHQQHYLDASKWYVGKAAIAQCGIVMAKHGAADGGMQAVFLDHETIKQHEKSTTLQRQTMPLTTLQAAHMGSIQVRKLELHPSQLLGSHLPSHQVLYLLHQTFNLMRPTVGAMALGMARAILDHVQWHYQDIYCSQHQPWLKLRQQWQHLHQHHHGIADHIDRQPDNLALGSRAKLLGMTAIHSITKHLFYDDHCHLMLHDAWLSKWCRDAWGLAFMEGISAVHYQNIYHSCKRQHHMSTTT